MPPADLRHETVAADGVRLHVVRAGAERGPPVLLLHGFPEHWYSWRQQIPALAAAGFSVFAPDLRGYNLSDKPRDRAAYRLKQLVADVAALALHAAQSSGHPRVHVAGHDWGGIIAWTFAAGHPDLLDKLVILNAPHIRPYLREVRRPRQMLRSWYVLYFQFVGLAEFALSARDFRVVRRIFTHSPARPGAFTESDIDGYVGALARPGALKAALNYYRANTNPREIERASSARTEADTLIIWGDRDHALIPELLDGIHDDAPRAQVHRIPDAGHWVQNEAPDEVNRAMLRFLHAP